MSDDDLFKLPEGGVQWDLTSLQIRVMQLVGQIRLLEERIRQQELNHQQAMLPLLASISRVDSDLKDTRTALKALDLSLQATVKDLPIAYAPRAELEARFKPLNWMLYTAGGTVVLALIAALIHSATGFKP